MSGACRHRRAFSNNCSGVEGFGLSFYSEQNNEELIARSEMVNRVALLIFMYVLVWCHCAEHSDKAIHVI